jgi:hypothetical protein
MGTAHQDLENLVGDVSHLFTIRVQALVFGNESVWVKAPHDWNYQHTSSYRHTNFLVGPVALLEARHEDRKQRIHGLQASFDFVLPLTSWLNVDVRNES